MEDKSKMEAMKGDENDLIDKPQYPSLIMKNIEYTRTMVCPVSPSYLKEQRVITRYDADNPLVDSYRLLRTRVMRYMEQNGFRTLGITSAVPGEGKTLTAINLGLSIALERNNTVLAIDADLRSPSMHKYFGINPINGIEDHLRLGLPVADILINPEINKFVILPAKGIGGSSSELLTSQSMMQLIDEVKNRYQNRIVIFDLPPVLVGDDVIALADHLDTLLIVIEEGKTQSHDLAEAIDRLKGMNILGTVLNKSRKQNSIHSYSDYYSKKR